MKNVVRTDCIINKIVVYSLLLVIRNSMLAAILPISEEDFFIEDTCRLYCCSFEVLDYSEICTLTNRNRSTTAPVYAYQPAFKHTDLRKLLIYVFSYPYRIIGVSQVTV